MIAAQTRIRQQSRDKEHPRWQADAVKKLYQGKLTAFAESPDWTVGVQLGCRRGDLNDAVTRVFERPRAAVSTGFAVGRSAQGHCMPRDATTVD